ncbi:hypothetical protein P3X46_014090 [Hevea brasiliensis]|uniref:PGG domain-containing protein n=1 Tax=Hevea brasiliensis TaxID=3981 RepID=A0ABQ9M5M2_HEVBR|nr:ankyrin repeat-containing protein ITN1-like [Hevea brasiliensis]KAJ9175544.1 hypothetical protein P3X46_014090 [Hevea brasiliensis]
MERRPTEENIIRLYTAAMEGDADTLERLIQNDQCILNKVSLTSFSETPLHISSLLGHLDFTVTILRRNSKMAMELDAMNRSPLHLACAEGHTETVKALLGANNDVCLIRDQDGRVPLHLAAMRGRVEIIKQLVSERPESTSMVLDGDTVLHLCVKYNHLEALKLLVSFACHDDELLRVNEDGNTILHLAAILKQLETIKYLLSVFGVKAGVNTLNKMGYTALDVLEHSLCQDFSSLEIRKLLMEAAAIRAMDPNNLQPKPTIAAIVSRSKVSTAKTWFRKFNKYLEYKGDWIEETRGSLMIVATVIATMTFQVGINPPGGVWQQNTTSSSEGSFCSSDNVCRAGTSVFSYNPGISYYRFLTFNSIAFVSSISVILLLVSGFPLKNKLCMWLLTLAMCVTISFAALTYLASLEMVNPYQQWDNYVYMYYIQRRTIEIWVALLIVVGAIYTTHFLSWSAKKLRGGLRCMLQRFRQKQQQTSSPRGQDINI